MKFIWHWASTGTWRRSNFLDLTLKLNRLAEANATLDTSNFDVERPRTFINFLTLPWSGSHLYQKIQIENPKFRVNCKLTWRKGITTFLILFLLAKLCDFKPNKFFRFVEKRLVLAILNSPTKSPTRQYIKTDTIPAPVIRPNEIEWFFKFCTIISIPVRITYTFICIFLLLLRKLCSC